MNTFRNLATASVAIVALASVAQAQITQNASVARTATTATINTTTGTVSVNKFNSALGTLNSIFFKIDGTLISSATVSNAATANGNADINSLVVNGRIRLTDNIGDNLVETFPTSYIVGDGLTPPYAGQTFLNPSPQSIVPGATFSALNLTATTSGTKTSTVAAILSTFTGNSGDTINLFTAGTASLASDISGGNTSSSQSSNYSAGIQVVYNYTPATTTPEASSLVFGVIGVVGLVVRARRRTAK